MSNFAKLLNAALGVRFLAAGVRLVDAKEVEANAAP